MNRYGIATREVQNGATLVVALVFLGVITMLSIAAMRDSVVGMRMSRNEEARFFGMQAAQALTEAIISNRDTTPVIGDAGFSICTAGEAGCDRYGIALPAVIANEVAQGNLSARIERLDPEFKSPPRTVDSSLDKFSAASFQIVSTYDRSDEGFGRVRIVEGLMVLAPN